MKTADDRTRKITDAVMHKEGILARARRSTWSAADHFEAQIGSEPTLNAKTCEMTRSSRASDENGNVQSTIVADTLMDSSMGRIFRAELERVVLPEIQGRLDTLRADTEAELIGLRQNIEDMAQKVENRMTKVSQSPDIGDRHCAIKPLGRVDPYGKVSQPVHQWKKSWIFRWRIGTLWVTLVCRTEYLVESMSSVQPTRLRPARRTYLVFIDFLPMQSLIKLRGLSLTYSRGSDCKGYSVLCPHLTTFAVIPEDSLIMRYAEENDVEGLRNVLTGRRAAPSDRNVKGETPLHVSPLCPVLRCYG